MCTLRYLLRAACGCQAAAAFCKQRARSCSHFCCQPSVPVIPPYYWATTMSGMRIISEKTSSPLACVTLAAEAGSRYETQCNNGVCHFFEHMACHGLTSLSGIAFEQYITDIGAHLTIHTDREYQAFICTCPQEEVENIISIYARFFSELDCNVTFVQKAMSDVQKELYELENNPKQLCFDYLHQTCFQGTTMARSPSGPYSNYQHFSKSFLEAFTTNHYQPFRLVLSVSSIHCHETVMCWAQSFFQALSSSSSSSPSITQNVEEKKNIKKTTNVFRLPSRFTGSMIRFRDDSLPFCHIAIAVETGGYNSRDNMTLRLMKHIIGQWNETQCQGYNTWPMLAHASAISKLCYSYESFYIPYRDIGLFGVYFVIKKEDDFEDAILMIQDQWMNMCTTLGHLDVERAASALKLELAKSTDGCVASTLDMALQLMFTGSRRNVLELWAKVDYIKSPEVQNLANHIIYDRCPAVAAIGPTEAVPDYNRIRGGMYWLRV